MDYIHLKLAIPFLLSFLFVLPKTETPNPSITKEHKMSCSVGHHSSSSERLILSKEEKDIVAHNAAILEQMLLDGQKLKIPVRAVVFDGSGLTETVLSESEIQQEIDYTNVKYLNEGFNVELVLVDFLDTVNDDLYDGYTCDQSNQWLNCDEPELGDYIDSAYINLLYLNLAGPSQHASFPWDVSNAQANTVVLNEGYLDFNGWSLMHELGHTFGLLHTFQGNEAVTRDPNDSCYNCETKGDSLCDTPAVPNFDFGGYQGIYSTGEDECENAAMFYNDNSGNEDDCGVPYIMTATAYENIMNYGHRHCSNSKDFTDGQVARMWSYMPLKVSQLDMTLVGHCNFVNINLGNETVLNGQYIETPREITSSQIITSWDNQLNFYGAEEGVTLVPGFQAKGHSNFKAVPVAEGCN